MENNTTNFVNNPDQKMQRYASGDEKANPREYKWSLSNLFGQANKSAGWMPWH